MKQIFLNLKIKHKILFLIALILTISMGLFLLFSTLSGNKVIQFFAIDEANLDHIILQQALNEQRSKLNESSLLIAKRNVTKKAIVNRDYKTLLEEIMPKAKNEHSDILVILDKNGRIISDLNNPKRFGDKFDSLASLIAKASNTQKTILSFEIISAEDIEKESKKLKEQTTIKRIPTNDSKENFIDKDIEKDALVNVVITPIKSLDDKSVIGTVIAASILNKNFAIVDKVKEGRSGTEITIFKDDLRITTTVKKNDKRAIGTLLSKKVVNNVLIDGNEYTGQAMVIGKPYWSKYSPIKSSEGKVIGAIFTAVAEDYLTAIFTKFFTGNLLICFIIVITVCVIIANIFSRIITKPIEDLRDKAQQLGRNDFTVNIEDNNNEDEIGDLFRSFKGFILNLKTLIINTKELAHNVKENASSVNAAADQTAEGSQQTTDSISQLAKGAQEVSQSIEQGAININKLNNAIQGIAKEAEEITALGNKTQINANEGNIHVKNAVNKIDCIKNVADNISVTITELGKLSSEIEIIVDLIKNIAGQTNLLALNAAIEAARAGEHGKGFAVVADEVKKLATESAEATEKINRMIKEIQQKTSIAVDTVKETSNAVDEGVLVINDAGQALKNIINQVNTANAKIHGITTDIGDVAKNSEDIVRMIENISAVIEETAASSEEISSITQKQTGTLEEISSSSNILANISDNLNKHISVFKV